MKVRNTKTQADLLQQLKQDAIKTAVTSGFSSTPLTSSSWQTWIPTPWTTSGNTTLFQPTISFQKYFDVVTGKVENVVLANNQLAPPIPDYYHRNYPLASTFNHTTFELDREKKVWMLTGTEFGSIPFVAVPEDLWGECIAQQVTDKLTT